MNVEFNYNFFNTKYNESVNTIYQKSFLELTTEEKTLFKEFIICVLSDKKIWGRNKSSADYNQINNYTHIINPNIVYSIAELNKLKIAHNKFKNRLQNYNKFLAFNFRHYHLVDKESQNFKLTNEVLWDFIDGEGNKDSVNTCGLIVNYQLIDNKIIIHSISKHATGEWDELSLLTYWEHSEYSECKVCGYEYSDQDLQCPNPNCLSKQKISNNIVKQETGIGDRVSAEIIRVNGKKEKDLDSKNSNKYIFSNNIISNYKNIPINISNINHIFN